MQMIQKKIITAMLILVVLAAGSGTALAGWTVTDLGALSDWGMSTATAINNNGQVVGYASTGEFNSNGLEINHAFIWSKTTGMQDLGVIGGSSAGMESRAYGINDNGQIVGTAQMAAGGNSYAFLYNGGTMQNLNVVGTAYGINNNGLVTGSYDTGRVDSKGNPIQHAFRWNSSIQDLGTYSTYSETRSFGRAINAGGHVAAYDEIDMGQGATSQAFIWSNGSKQGLPLIGGTNAIAYGINNTGQVVGVSSISGEKYTHAFLYSNGTRDLGTLAGGRVSQANQINNNGQIVGYSDKDSSGFRYAVLWTINADGSVSITDLNDLVSGSGWVLGEAIGINDKGEIVGWGTFGDDFGAVQHAFLLSQETAPVPLPPAMYMFGSALIGLVGVRRRFKSSEQ